MSNSHQQEGKLNFSVDSQLLFELGEQLVARPSIALAELVKNAYDADATQVQVTFEEVGKRGGSIIVEDNGHGMTFEEIEGGWMRIAASGKRTNTKSPKYHRSLTGAKGIGRFATRRLGKRLELRSVVKLLDGTKEAIAVKFDWSDFTSGTEISDVTVDYKRVVAPNEHSTGVRLHILDAHDIWSPEDIEELKRDLIGLVSPFPTAHSASGLNRDPGFKIILDIDGDESNPTDESDLSEEFLEAGWAVIEGQVDSEGYATYTADFLRTANPREILRDNSELYKELDGMSFRIYYHVYEKEYYTHLSFSLITAQKLGREQGGVRIYLDGFRVYPYGEPSDDWLRLADIRSRNVDMAAAVPMSEVIKEYGKIADRPHLLIPGKNALFGYLYLSQEKHANSNIPLDRRLSIKASREGFVENVVFEKLRRFVQRGIYWLTMQYASIREDSKVQNTQPKITFHETKQDLEELPNRLADRLAEVASRPRQNSLLQDETQKQIEAEKLRQEVIAAVTPEITAISANFDAVEAGYESEQQQLISVIAMLRLLASAGTSLLVMNHQLSPIQHMASGIKFDLEQLETNIPSDIRQDYLNILTQIEDWQNIVDAVVTPLTSLLSVENRERRKRWILYETVDEIRKSLSYYMRENNIDFVNDVPPGLRTPPIYRAELYAILLNLLTNALKAVYGYPERRILVTADKVDDKMLLHMVNTGKKAPREKWQSFFRPFITDSIPEAGLGVGTGLGLNVIRDTVDEYGGRAQFIEVEQPWQTGLEIILPYRDEK